MRHRGTRTGALACAILVSFTISPSHAVTLVADTPNPTVRALPATEITVAAASSLTSVFPLIGRAFSKRYPNIKIRFTFAGSNALIEQVRAGAPVDVIATASEVTMTMALGDGLIGRPLLFAKNSMAIVMPAGNPGRVRSIQDLADPMRKVAVCADRVPCGTATVELLAKNKVRITPVTKELDVRDVLGKVLADEVDAGIVYVTDIRAAGMNATSVLIPAAYNVTTTYPIATVKESRHSKVAQAFVDYVRFSTSGQGLLRAWGFSRPW